MLADEQFEKLLEKISLNQSDRERLIRIETIVQMSLENENKCRADIFGKVEAAKLAATKAHERLDSEVKSRYVFTGILLSMTCVVTVVGVILKLTGKI